MSTYRMSSIGDCERAMSAQQLGYEAMPAPEWLKLAAREGERHEDWVVRDLESEGYTVSDRHREVTLALPMITLVGHIDGIIEKDGERRLLEIKSMSRFRYEAFMRNGFDNFRTYARQITCYHEAVQLPVFYSVKNRDNGVRKDIPIDDMPMKFQQVLGFLASVEVSVRKGVISDTRTLNEYECRECPYRYLCIAEKAFDELTSKISKHDIQHAVSRCREVKLLEEQIKELREAYEPVLKRAVVEVGGKLIFDGLKVTYYPESSLTTYPAENLKKYVPKELLDKCAKESKRKEFIKTEDLR